MLENEPFYYLNKEVWNLVTCLLLQINVTMSLTTSPVNVLSITTKFQRGHTSVKKGVLNTVMSPKNKQTKKVTLEIKETIQLIPP